MSVRYAICGLSNRGLASFVLPLVGISGGRDSVLGYGSNTEDFSAHGTVVAIVDVDRKRVEDFIGRLLPEGYPPIAVYHPDRKSTRLNSSHVAISYAVVCLKEQKGCMDVQRHKKLT